MPIDKRVRTAAEALADVADGATVFITGFGGAGFPNVLIRALRERGTRDLTLVVNSATHRFSLTHELIEAGLVRKVICSAARGQGKDLSPFEQLWKDGKIEKADRTFEKGDMERLGRELVEPMIDEAQRCLDERVVENADLVDAGVIFCTGFAPFRGGPLHYKASQTPAAPARAAAAE